MKANFKIILLIALILSNITLLSIIYEKQSQADRYVKYNISSEISRLFLEIDKLDRYLLEDNKYICMDMDIMKGLISDIEASIYNIDKSLGKLKLLNKNYDLNLYGLTSYMYMLKQKIMSDIRPSEEDIKLLNSIKELRVKYSSASMMQTYENQDKLYKRMSLPDQTKLFFEELNEITGYGEDLIE